MKIILKVAATAVLLLPGIAFAQTETDSTPPVAATPTPSDTWLPNTLFKLGTGISRKSEYSNYGGLALPITLGVEHQLMPKFSVYGNLSPLFWVGGRGYSWDRDRPFAQLRGINTDLGARLL